MINQILPKTTHLNSLQLIVLIFTFLIIIIIGIGLRLHNLGNVKVRSVDEIIYSSQAKVIAERGFAGFKSLVEWYESDPRLWVAPPPERVGYLLPLSLLVRETGIDDPIAGAYFSCFFSIIALILVMVMGVRFFNYWAAIIGLLFLSVSPMDLAISRRAWQDAMIGCIGLAHIWAACEIMRNTHSKIWYVLYVLAGSWLIMIKESGVVIYGISYLLLFVVLVAKGKAYRQVAILTASCIAGVSLSIGMMSFAVGGIGELANIVRHIKQAVPGNTIATVFQNVSGLRFIKSFWLVSPLAASLCIAGIISNIAATVTDSPATRMISNFNIMVVNWIIIFSAVLLVIIIMTPYLQNLRYASVVYGPFYLLSGLGFSHIISIARRYSNRKIYILLSVCFVMIAIAGAEINYGQFKSMIAHTDLRDLLVPLIEAGIR